MIMIEEIERVLIDEKTISDTVGVLAERINNDYKNKSVVLTAILKGGAVFASDLMRRLQIDVTLEFMQVSSYGSGCVSQGDIKIIKDTETDLRGRDVIIAEDIIDSGNTLKEIVALMEKRGARVEVCTLLSKPARRLSDVRVKYTGIEIPDEFVVGYGMDYDERFRTLPYIGVLKREIYSRN